MDSIWGQIWPNPYPDGKVHRGVVNGLIPYIHVDSEFADIITLVTISGIEDDLDALATARHLRDIRDEMRNMAKAVETLLAP